MDISLDTDHSVKKSSAPQDRSATQLFSSTVHAWVATTVLASIIPHRTSKDDWGKP